MNDFYTADEDFTEVEDEVTMETDAWIAKMLA